MEEVTKTIHALADALAALETAYANSSFSEDAVACILEAEKQCFMALDAIIKSQIDLT